MEPVVLRTPRLLLRPFSDSDLAPFAAMNADPRVMEHFPSLLARDASDAAAGRIRQHFDANGWGLWAVEIPGEMAFAGFVGIVRVPFESHFTPAVEIGWRLVHGAWGRGVATEGAREAMRFGFEEVGLPEIVSMTIPANVRSQRVMQKLGMVRRAEDDFDHPRIPEGSPVRRHVLYRMSRARFDELRRAG